MAYVRRRAEIRRTENISVRLGSTWYATLLDEERKYSRAETTLLMIFHQR